MNTLNAAFRAILISLQFLEFRRSALPDRSRAPCGDTLRHAAGERSESLESRRWTCGCVRGSYGPKRPHVLADFLSVAMHAV